MRWLGADAYRGCAWHGTVVVLARGTLGPRGQGRVVLGDMFTSGRARSRRIRLGGRGRLVCDNNGARLLDSWLAARARRGSDSTPEGLSPARAG
jgi:hypothetical protein